MKRISLALMLLVMLFALSGCVTDIKTAGDVAYDAATDTLTIPLRFGFFDMDGKTIGYNVNEGKFTTHYTDPQSLSDVVIYYATTDAGIAELKYSENYKSYSDNIKKKSLADIVFTDDTIKEQVTVTQGMKLPDYDAKTGSVEYKLETNTNGSQFHNGYLNMLMGISGLKLEDGQQICVRVYIQTNHKPNSNDPNEKAEKLSGPIDYQYFEPVVPEVPDIPQTGDASDMPRYVLLLSASALALCVMSLRRRKA
ncbi:MAG: hypothetical protein IKJ11_07855 [Clostridia bacterium]|nr:hypothetical protein [Clostridia bacterium]